MKPNATLAALDYRARENPDDRIPPKKLANIRHAASCLAAIGPANRPMADRFVDWKVGYDQRRTASVTFYAQIARDLDSCLDGRPYASITHEDAHRYVVMRSATVAQEGLSNELTRVKHFLKWCFRESGQTDLQTLPYRLHQALTIRRAAKRAVKREVPLTETEYQALLEVRKHDPSTQALYSFCWDADARIGEALVLNWSEYQFQPPSDGGAVVTIPDVDGFTKTGDGEIYIHQSVAWMKTWADLHPFQAAPDTPIFTSLKAPYRRASYHGVLGRLKRDLERAGIRKDVHWHLFRKTGATRRVRFMAPDEFTAFHRWQPGSRVATQYIMDSKQQARTAIRREAGLSDDGTSSTRVNLGVKTCPFCAEEIKAAAIKCKHCGEMLGEPVQRPTR